MRTRSPSPKCAECQPRSTSQAAALAAFCHFGAMTMLVDDYAAFLAKWGALASAVPDTSLQRAQRFVLSPLSVDTVTMLADPDAIERSRDYIFAPAQITWLEWRGRTPGFAASERHGLLISGEGNPGHGAILAGSLTYVSDAYVKGQDARLPLAVSFQHDLQADDRDIITPSDVTGAARMMPETAAILASLDLSLMSAFLGAAFALIGTPRLSELIPHDHAKLNLVRERSGKMPLLSWQEVRITIDAGDVKKGEQRGGEGMRLHHVRSHLRMRLGKVELVSPHWRGNPALGVVLHRHKVVRAEDEPGEWQGGPLPAPRIIEPLRNDDEEMK